MCNSGKLRSMLITGATGFVGSELIRKLTAKALDVVGCVRSAGSVLPVGVERFVVGDLTKADIKRSLALNNIDVVIHTAARAHIKSGSGPELRIDCHSCL